MKKQMEVWESYYVVQVHPGEYYLGDPCYVIMDKHWDKLLDQTDYFCNPVGEVENFFILGFHTKYGDGEYEDQFGNSYPVDAGTIGLVPKEYVDRYKSERQYLDGMNLIKFDNEVKCYNSENGMLVFGEYEIMTGD